MARGLFEEDYYYMHGGPVPVKWTAPEVHPYPILHCAEVYNYYKLTSVPDFQALNFKKYTTASDVWSYAVVLFEIWSLGVKPFASISNLEVKSAIYL